jgi:hypothetical protein
MTIANGAVLILILLLVWAIYRLNRTDGNGYNVSDILMGPNNRASAQNHILVGFALLSGWAVVDMELKQKDVTYLLLGVLGIFVTGKTVTVATDMMNRDTSGGSSTSTSTTSTVVTKPSAPPAQPPKPMPLHSDTPIPVTVVADTPIPVRETPPPPYQG